MDFKNFKIGAIFKQLQVLKGQNLWTNDDASRHLVNEGAVTLRTYIVNTHNRVNPFREWMSAAWFYAWFRDDDSKSHCILMSFISVVGKGFPLYCSARHT